MLIFISAKSTNSNEGTVILCNEEHKIAAEKAGVQIIGFSKETDPANPGMHVQYRRVLWSEKVVTANNGERPWYFFVHLGPVIPNTDSYVFWPAGDPPPWKKSISQKPMVPAAYLGTHEHYGCDHQESFCKRYNNHPVTFTSFGPGKVRGTSGTSGTTFEGSFSGTVFQFTYFLTNGVTGQGTFNFSPDFRTFNGTFVDENGHRGVWSGRIQ